MLWGSFAIVGVGASSPRQRGKDMKPTIQACELFDACGDQLLIFSDMTEDGGAPLLGSAFAYSADSERAEAAESIAVLIEAGVMTLSSGARCFSITSVSDLHEVMDPHQVESIARLAPWERTRFVAAMGSTEPWCSFARVVVAMGGADPARVRA